MRTKFHDETVRGVASKRIQCDEAWAFCYAKQKNVPTAKAAPGGAGDVWTWTALDADSKLVLTWQVGRREASYALALMDDLRTRIITRVQLTTDGHRAYLGAVEEAFGADIDYAMLVKLYGAGTGGNGHERKYSPSECIGARKQQITGNPDRKHVSTSYTERHNLTMRMSIRRFTRLIKCFQQKGRKPLPRAGALFRILQFRSHSQIATGYASNGCRVSDRLWSMEDIVALIDAAEGEPKKRGPYEPRQRAEISK